MEDQVWQWQYVKKYVCTPQEIYAGATQQYKQQWGDRIIGFRPPRKGEYLVSIMDGTSSMASIDYEESNPRFILKPLPKVLRRFTVTIYDEPPQLTDYGMAAETCNYPNPFETGMTWKATACSHMVGNRNYKRCEVVEEKKENE